MKKIVLTVLAVLLIEGIGWTLFVFSGAYSVTTANHDNAFINWWLDHGTTRSIKAHASGLAVPDLENPAMVQAGFQHFDEMCAQCHGAPGQSPDELAKGLWPEAPDLREAVPEWTPAQLFWTTKNGIKFTAMPGWGATHSDDKIWAIVAFLEKLPKLSPEDYQQMKTNTVAENQTAELSASPAPETGEAH